jgi:hypothetical protein
MGFYSWIGKSEKSAVGSALRSLILSLGIERLQMVAFVTVAVHCLKLYHKVKGS